MPLVVERDGRGRWIVTIAGVSRSRRDSLEAALADAAGVSTAATWIRPLAETLTTRALGRADTPTRPARQ
jgi:hypothetical protein